MTANLSKFLIRASNRRPSIRCIVTASRSRRAKFRKISWMLGWADNEARGSDTWAIRERLLPTHTARNERFLDAVQSIRPFAGTVEPDKVRLFTKPDQLPSSVPAVLLNDERSGRGLIAHTAQHLHHLTIDQPAEGPGIRGHAAREQSLHFIDDPSLELTLDASRHTL